MLSSIHWGNTRSQAGGRAAEVLDTGLVAWRALTFSGWLCCSAPRAGAVSVPAKAGAVLKLLSETKGSVAICGVSSVYSGTRRGVI